MFIGQMIGGLFVGFLIFFYMVLILGIGSTDEMRGKKIDNEVKIGAMLMFAVPTLSLVIWVLVSENIGMLVGSAISFGYMFNKTFPSKSDS